MVLNYYIMVSFLFDNLNSLKLYLYIDIGKISKGIVCMLILIIIYRVMSPLIKGLNLFPAHNLSVFV